MNILLCDDERSVLDSLSHIPILRKHSVTAVTSGEEAIREVKTGSKENQVRVKEMI